MFSVYLSLLESDLYDKLRPLIEKILNTDTSEEALQNVAIVVFYVVIPIMTCIISDAAFRRWRTEVTLGRETKALPKPTHVISNKNQEVFDVDRPQYHTVDYCHWFIQNNTNAIVQWMKMFTPNFQSKNFMAFVKDVFEAFINVRDAEKMGGRVSFDVEAIFLPDRPAEYGNCYLHNYILTNGYENLKVFVSMMLDNPYEEAIMQKYFLTFSKKNPRVGVIDGQFLNIECPNCGGTIDMKSETTNICPYCKATVTFEEADWILTEIEFIKEDTLICNNAVIKSY